MRNYVLFLFLLILPGIVHAQFSVSGGTYTTYSPDYSSRLNDIFVFNSLSGASLSYTTNSASVKFYRYSSSQKEEIPASDINNTSSGGQTTYQILNLQDGWGYIAEINGTTAHAAWVINYAQHIPVIHSVSFGEEDCESVQLLIDKSDVLQYYGSENRQVFNVTRRYSIIYQTLEWDEQNRMFIDKEEILEQQNIGNQYSVNAPLQDTEFTIRGDQFGEYFGNPVSFLSPMYQTKAVKAHLVAIHDGEEIEDVEALYSTSAPAEIDFYGYGNEPTTVYYSWRIYDENDPNNSILSRTGDLDLHYIFNQAGTFRVKFEVASNNNQCVDSVVFRISISESELDVPNYFSPGDSPGVNDVFKVKYKSLVKFKCTIFNRWGNKIYEFTDPEEGWDGTYKGKLVNPGVYFYVIDALGSDGVKYKKGGDINILRSR